MRPRLFALLRPLGAIVCFLILLGPSPARAVTAEEILEVLKKKGIITQEEYEILRNNSSAPSAPRAATDSAAAPSDKPAPAPTAATTPEAKPASGAPAEQKAQSKARDEVRGQFKDGFIWESADKSAAIALRGRILADYRNFGGQDAIGADTFDIRQAYFGVDGKFYDAVDFRLRGDWSTLAGATSTVCADATCRTTNAANASTTHLDEAWFNFGWWKAAQLRFGQFRIPYGFELSASALNLDFTERAMLSAFDPNKDRGVMLHGAPAKGVYYGISYANGSGKNVNDTNQRIDNKDFGLRLTANLAEVFDRPGAIYHLGATFTQGTIPNGNAVPSVRTEGRGFSFFPQLALGSGEVKRTRAMAEGALAYGSLKLQSELLKARFAPAGGIGRDIKAYYGSLTWLVTGEHYADAYGQARMNRLRPRHDFSPGKSCCGAFEVGLRYSKFDGEDFDDSGGFNAPTNAAVAKAWTLGVKWIVNPNSRFLLNLIQTEFGNDISINAAPTDSEKAVTLRGQFDF